ncbi:MULTISPECIES: hypothetical protein [Bacillus cereus group]|uniref:hypothetical protein n=1 Tax=Bacillus cereus group TaxID=86661 RepID=UPI000BEC09A9|nr:MULTISPECIES: hypothetical protein [Bacillus cereus group]PEF83948.1 hypothetical protein CON51_29145 [Bacillus thuringiensis]PES47797.1 hypothetical protein CN506_29120 [Bacillus thuringiensis]PFO99834.1 hypothetical protein COJ91_28505 [Bacillus thuringiensis]PFS49324.1 hypothetical protein COK64_32805 [Bacillus thuringiensis]PGL57772.1 hypothetical protein CN939_29585 [Bacillus thuringiensis]
MTEKLDNLTHEEEKLETKTDELKDDEKKVDLTQAELNDLISRTKNKVKEKYSDYDEIKAKADAADAAAEAARLEQLDEVERAKELAAKKDEEIAAANERIAAFEREKRESKVTNAFDKAAKAAHIPEEYLKDARMLAGITDETEVDKIAEIVEKLATDRPYLVRKEEVKQREIGGASNGNSTKTEKTDEQILAELAAKARKYGRVEDKIEYANMKRKLGRN